MQEFLSSAKKNKWKLVLSTSDGINKLSTNIDDSNNCNLGIPYYKHEFNKNDNVILVLGEEDAKCEYNKEINTNLIIPPNLDINSQGKFPYNIVDMSLNVGVSVGILVSYIKNQIVDLMNERSKIKVRNDTQNEIKFSSIKHKKL